jgi:glycosyltransferase involved in cell wall biosynthesis
MSHEGSVMQGTPIRVLQLGSPAGMFGAERWIMALAKHLPRDQVETVIGVIQDEESGREPPLCEHAREHGFETLTIKAPGKLSIGAVGGLREAIAARRLDILHSHFYKPTVFGALAVRGTRCKLLATPHGWTTDGGLKVQAYEWLERLVFSQADVVAPLSRDLEAGLRRLPWLKGKIELITNGVDLSEVTGSDSVADEVTIAKAGGAFVVGYIGQLIARKRVDTLIEAFASLQNESAVLFVIGDGDQRDALIAMATRHGVADRVRFMGFRDDRLDFLRGFDVLVLPSALEGIPRCLMEAMAAGVPVVGTRIPGISDLIDDAQTGLMFDVGSAEQLEDCLARLSRDGALREGLATDANRRVTESFSASAMAVHYQRLYRQLTVERSGASKTRTGA